MTFVGRVIGAARLDQRVYEEVEADRGATVQALGVVALAAIANGAGHGGQGHVIGHIVRALFMLLVWASLSYAIGVYLIPEPRTKANVGEMVRTIGFAASPGLLWFLRFVPLLGPILAFAIGIWIVLAMVVAVRQGLDFKSFGRAAAVCMISWFVAHLIGAMLFISAGSVLF